MPALRFLTSAGFERLEAYIAALGQDAAADPPTSLLTSEEFSGGLGSDIEVEQRAFGTKMEMAQYVMDSFSEQVRESNPHSRGIWGWLSLFWIDQLLPPDMVTGNRTPNKPWYYVPSTSHYSDYRHLLLGPYRTFLSYGNSARLLLSAPLFVWQDVEEQLAGKREFLRLRGALEAADLLYFDERKGKPKSGITNRSKPGNIRRLKAMTKQFALTYDLHSMKGSQLVAMLPPEFDRFRS